MRNIAKKGGIIWFVLAVTPISSIISIQQNLFQTNQTIIQHITLAIQAFSIIIIIKYPKEVFN